MDRRLSGPVALHCLGGFVIAMHHHLDRPTNDVDYVEIVPRDTLPALQQMAGPGSMLARKHGLHLQYVAVASVPESYAERLADIFPGRFRNLRLFALDPHDLALSKLARNSPVDREDVARLARTMVLDPALLRQRYRQELRPGLTGDLERHDQTLAMWIQAYFP